MAFDSREAIAWQEGVRLILENPHSEENPWPHEYLRFYQLWGYLNAFYGAYYTKHNLRDESKEWKKIARFTLDERHEQLWQALVGLECIRCLARASCVGDGRNEYRPTPHVMASFQTLRREVLASEMAVEDVCQGSLCETRQPRCLDGLEQPPQQLDLTNPFHAKFTPLGATFAILYQLRNNLFHGSKLDLHRERNRCLIECGVQILQTTLMYLDGYVQGG